MSEVLSPAARDARGPHVPAVIVYGTLCVAMVAISGGAELLLERIHPSDGSQFALNGALFHALFAELGDVARDPGGWLWSYYEQYPALNVRRYPPLFGLAVAGIFSVTGVGIVGAKLTLLLFAAAFAVCAFLLLRRLLGDDLLAFCGCALLIAVPTVQDYYREVWLDIPSLALTLATILLYLRLDPAHPLTVRRLLPVLLAALAALYVYQLSIYLLAGVVLVMIGERRGALLRSRPFLICGALALLALLPLVLQALLLSPDNVSAALGTVPEGVERYTTGLGKTSVAYWIQYGDSLWQRFPVQVLGALLWGVTRTRLSVTRAQRLLLACFIVAYPLFSLMPARDPRYVLHLAVPLSFLAMVGLVDTVRLFVPAKLRGRERGVAAAVLTAVLALQAALLEPRTDYLWLEKTSLPARAVLAHPGEVRVLYSGPYSAAFVLALRGLDDERRARVYRGTVQLGIGDDIAAFLERHAIDFIVLEMSDSRTGLVEFDRLRDALLESLQQRRTYTRVAAFGLPIGRTQHDDVVDVWVFRRTADRTIPPAT